jgi:AraC-like DNA-binding protein
MTSQFNLRGPEGAIIMSADRMVYGGPQVQSELAMGGYVIYVSALRPISLTVGNTRIDKPYLAIVPPYVRHSIACGEGVRAILIEAESVAPELLQDDRFQTANERAREWANRIESGFQRWQSATSALETATLDLFFFGERLPPRRLDQRISHAVAEIAAAPVGAGSRTTAIAKDVGLSPSRLRHLFGDQVGVPIRRYRAWKRLRNAIQIALQEPNLLKLAMAAGYADASHMCHSMKLFFGEQPSNVCGQWRRKIVARSSTSERDSTVQRILEHARDGVR